MVTLVLLDVSMCHFAFVESCALEMIPLFIIVCLFVDHERVDPAAVLQHIGAVGLVGGGHHYR